MSKNLRKNKSFLFFLRKANQTQKGHLLKSATADQLKALKECTANVCAGNVPLTPGQILGLKKKKKKIINFFKSKSVAGKRLAIQNGGFINLVLSALLPVLTSLAADTVKNLISK